MEAISVFLPFFAAEPLPLPLPLGAALLRPTCGKLSSGSCERLQIKTVHEVICQKYRGSPHYFHERWNKNCSNTNRGNRHTEASTTSFASVSSSEEDATSSLRITVVDLQMSVSQISIEVGFPKNKSILVLLQSDKQDSEDYNNFNKSSRVQNWLKMVIPFGHGCIIVFLHGSINLYQTSRVQSWKDENR